jgi:TatD DNase family protein
MTYLADSHVHLHAYSDADVDVLLERGRVAGVDLIVGIPVDLATSRRTIDIAKSHAGVVATVGLHPAHLDERVTESTFSDLDALARDPAVGFVGEIGLDVVDGKMALDYQRAFFQAQLELAQKRRLPVNLHIHGAFDEAFAVIERVGLPQAGAIVHYFVGDESLARRALDLGLHISVGKPVTRVENASLRRAVPTIPLDRLVLETDSYPLPGRQTEPADVRLVAQAVADLRGCSVDEVADATTANLRRMLGPRFRSCSIREAV